MSDDVVAWKPSGQVSEEFGNFTEDYDLTKQDAMTLLARRGLLTYGYTLDGDDHATVLGFWLYVAAVASVTMAAAFLSMSVVLGIESAVWSGAWAIISWILLFAERREPKITFWFVSKFGRNYQKQRDKWGMIK